MKEAMDTSVKTAPKEKPVISFVYFVSDKKHGPENSNSVSCGGAWDKGWKNGALSFKLDLSQIPNAFTQDFLRLKGFVKSSYQETVLFELVKNIEARYISRIKGEFNPVVPLYDIALKVQDETIRIGCVWGGSLQSLILNIYIEPKLIPESMRGQVVYGAFFTKKHDLEVPTVSDANANYNVGAGVPL